LRSRNATKTFATQSAQSGHSPSGMSAFGVKADSPRGEAAPSRRLPLFSAGSPPRSSRLGGNAQPQTGAGSPVPVKPRLLFSALFLGFALMVHQNFCAAVVADENVATARKVVRRSHPHRHSANRARSRWRRWDTHDDYLQEWPGSQREQIAYGRQRSDARGASRRNIVVI
jgi:hypothetical protein